MKDTQIPDQGAPDATTIIKKLWSDTALYVPAKIIPGFLSVLAVAIFTRIFTPDEYGMYIIVATTTAIIIAVLSQWITQSILRYRPQYVQNLQVNVFNRNLVRLLFIVSVTFLLCATILYLFRDYLAVYRKFYIISVLIIVAGVWSNSLTVVLQSDLKSSSFTLYTVFGAVFKLAVPLILIYVVSNNIIFLLYGILASFAYRILPLLFSLFAPKGINNSIESSTIQDRVSLLRFFRKFYFYGFPMIGWFLGAQILNISDRYLIQIFRGSTEVGIYSSNYSLVASALAFVTMPLLTAAHPLLMKAGNVDTRNKSHIEHLISAFSRYFLLIILPIIIFIFYLYKDLARIMLGQDFRQGALILPIILIGLTAWNFAMFGHKGLELRNKTRTMLLYVVICAIVNIILNIIFIPRYGYMAAAVTTLVSFIIYPILTFFGTKADIKWRIPWLSGLRILIASAISLPVFFILSVLIQNVFFRVGLCAISIVPIYITLLVLLKEIKSYEIKYIATFFFRNKQKNPQ